MTKPPTATGRIRPKASKRKARSPLVEHQPRAPRQARSQRRFDAVLDATRRLLRHANIEDLSFQDIAGEAGISPASIHYMFPSMSALLSALIQRFHLQYTDEFADMERRLGEAQLPSWQAWIRAMAEANRGYFNAHRDIAEMALGPNLNRASRHAITEVNTAFAAAIIGALEKLFVMPAVPGLHRRVTHALEVFDALWGRAYLENGSIDDATFEESVQIVIAYLRTILPETLGRRDHE